MINMKEMGTRRLKVLVILTCLAALLPYGALLFMSTTGRMSLAYRSSPVIFLLSSVIWTGLLLATLSFGRWQGKVWWLLALFPLAFGPWLLMLYDWIFGLGP